MAEKWRRMDGYFRGNSGAVRGELSAHELQQKYDLLVNLFGVFRRPTNFVLKKLFHKRDQRVDVPKAVRIVASAMDQVGCHQLWPIIPRFWTRLVPFGALWWVYILSAVLCRAASAAVYV